MKLTSHCPTCEKPWPDCECVATKVYRREERKRLLAQAHEAAATNHTQKALVHLIEAMQTDVAPRPL